MVREVGLTDGVKSRNGCLKIVVNPDAAHCVVDGRIDHHRLLPRAYIIDLEVHVEEVAVTLLYPLMTETLDGVREIEEHGETGLVDTESSVTSLLGRTGSHVTRNEVTERRVTALEIVVTILLRNL